MMKHINTIWMCLLLLVAGVSCSDSESSPKTETVTPPKITLDSDKEMIVSDLENEVTLSFTANKDWTLTSNQTWCKPNCDLGKAGKITAVIAIDKNETYDSREAQLTISSENSKVHVKITQAQLDAIVIAKQLYKLESEKTQLTFEVQSNVEFDVTSDVEWIQQLTTKGRALTTHKLDFSIAEQNEKEDREGHIFFTKGNIKQTVTVLQRGNNPQVIIVTHELTTFMAPLLEGTISHGQIFWGDEQIDAYSQQSSHTYNEAGVHDVTLQSKGATSVLLKSVEGVTRIDLSKF